MSFRRSYDDGCGAAHALDIVGERWAILVVRELVFGPKRFTDLRTGLPGISPNVLTQRLEELEQGSVLRRRKLPPPASAWVYELTEWGAELGPVIMALGRWGARSPLMAPGHPVSAASVMMSFRTMFNAQAAGDWSAHVGLRFGDEHFRAVVAQGNIHIERGEAAEADAVIEAEPSLLAAVVYGGHKLADALRTGALVIEGNKAVAKRWLTLFVLPRQAPSTAPVAQRA